MANNHIIVMQKICKSFGGLHALRDVTLELQHNEILGLVGDNAAGKSTLMKILTGAYQTDSGQIFFEGREVLITDPRVSKQLGIEMIYQDLELCPNLDVPSNLFLGKEILGRLFKSLKYNKMEKEALAILRNLKINIKNPRIQVSSLSGGQQQAVAIGKAVSFNPKVVIMDEPTANLAMVEAEKVMELTLQLKKQGISIIFISHRLDDVLTVTDRIFVLKHGQRAGIKETAKTNKDEIIKLMFM
jgi:simple sugar transport system ATP-binding protein